jgi:SAM-dependent methyltransferase
MRADEFAKMRALEETHWWFQGRRELLRSLARKLDLRDALILDAGCGTGFARKELGSMGTVIGLDAAEEAFAADPGEPRCIEGERRTGCLALIEKTPFHSDSFDLIVSLDVLEHLEDDLAALIELHRICKPGGYLLLTVPAYAWMWSTHDEALGHRRRYSAGRLSGVVRAAGFEVCKLSYLVSSVLPAAAGYRLLKRKAGKDTETSDLFPVPRPINWVLGALMKLESRLVWRISLPFGLTVALLARKTDADSVERRA